MAAESAPASASAPESESAALAPGGHDFGDQAREVFRVAGCGGSDPLPENAPAEVVQTHCETLHKAVAKWKRVWLAKADPFLRKHVPAGLPDKVFYPFGGGDLLAALATFPDATEYTIMSLEGIGDVRTIDTLPAERMDLELKIVRHSLVRLFDTAFSSTGELNRAYNAQLAGQLAIVLSAVMAHGYRPVSLRYFTLNPDGSLHYLTTEEIKAADNKRKRKEKRELAVSIFTNAELTFRKVGDDRAPLKVFRHIAFNLKNGPLKNNPALLAHLTAKGQVSVMTKAASHLLWHRSFSTIRTYLLENMAWMISDSTGVPPRLATAAGFEQETWGIYLGAYFPHQAKAVEQDFIKLWRTNPQQSLDFRYGYRDAKFNSHLMITRKRQQETP